MHFDKVTIDGEFNIMGRGLVLSTNFEKEGYDISPYDIGDTFNYKTKLYSIRSIEAMRNLFDGKMMPNIAFVVKEL